MRNFKPARESGFVLLKVLIMSGVAAVIMGGSYQLMKNRITWMSIIRIQQRMDLMQKSIESAGQSLSAMKTSADLHQGSPIDECLNKGNCVDDKGWYNVDLYDSLGNPLVGSFDINGKPCKGKNCLLTVTAELQLKCANGDPNCSQPSEIVTRYNIVKKSGAITTRSFPPVSGSLSLSTFSCPENEYVRAITSDGQLQCAPAEISPHGGDCTNGLASVGLNNEGYLLCQKVENFCKRAIGLSVVLDVSGSMSYLNTLGTAIPSVIAIGDRMDTSRDSAAYTNFSNKAQTKISLTSAKKNIFQSLLSERPNGGTNMTAGLQAGAATLDNFKGGEKIMIFVSDGFHNALAVESPYSAAKKITATGVRIFTVAVNEKADRNTLRRIASSPNDFFVAADGKELAKVLDDLTSSLCR